jgi:hypothetical protein
MIAGLYERYHCCAELSGYQECNDISFLLVENYRSLNRVSYVHALSRPVSDKRFR